MSEGVLVVSRVTVARGQVLSTAALVSAILAFIATAELVTTFVNAVTGMALHALLLSALIAGGSLWGEGTHSTPISRLLLSLTMVPLIRILSLSMPLTSFQPTYWYVVAGLPVFIALLVVMAALGLPAASVGLRLGRRLWLQLLITALGFGLGIMEYYILRSEPLIDDLTLEAFVVPALVLIIATGFLEELLFRGVLQSTALRVLGPFFGVVFVSAVFALLHIGYQSALDMAFVFAIALIYGWAVRKTGSIIGVSLSHGLTNIMLFLVVPFLDPISVGILSAGGKA